MSEPPADPVTSRSDSLAIEDGIRARIIDRLPAMVAYVDRRRVVTYANPRYAQARGLRLEDVVGRPLEVALAQILDRVEHRIEAALSGEAQDFQVSYATPAGKELWLRAQYIPDLDEGEGVRGCIALIEDVTERRKAEDAQARFQLAFDQGMEGSALHDKEGRFTYVNAAQAETYGYTPDELLGESWELLYSEAEAERIRTVHFPELQRDGSWRGELVGRKKDGSVFDVEVSLTLLVDEAGAPDGIVCNCRDVTARKQAESELRQLHKLQAIGHLTAGVAHDFNNLLTVVLGNLDLCAQEAPGAGSEWIESAVQAAERGMEVTNRLLLFARQAPLQTEFVDVRGIVDDLRPLLTRLLGDRVDLAVEHACTQPLSCRLDRSQLENTLVNLAANARDAMPNGGRVTVETAERLEPADPSSGAAQRFASLSIRDEGSGMSEPVREQMFDPFFSTKSEGSGTGLGLSMVHGFVLESGGRIAVETRPGHGTEIRIDLPLAEGCRPNAMRARSGEFVRGAGRTVLVVEDRPPVAELVRSMLEKLEYSVLVAHDGREALEVLGRAVSCDLVLSDVQLPGTWTGLELVRRIRDQHPDLPVALMTGVPSKDLESAAGVPVLRKPFRFEDLGRFLAEILSLEPAPN